MLRIENSPEFEAEMEKRREEAVRYNASREAEFQAAYDEWKSKGFTWLPMESCPFDALDSRYDMNGAILVTDGKTRTIATVNKRYGRPIFWKVPPQMVLRDYCICFEDGVEDPREDIPAWWWEWTLTDVFGDMQYAGGEECGKEEVKFIATAWTFFPELDSVI